MCCDDREIEKSMENRENQENRGKIEGKSRKSRNLEIEILHKHNETVRKTVKQSTAPSGEKRRQEKKGKSSEKKQNRDVWESV